MTYRNCPFCGMKTYVISAEKMWFFECAGAPKHRFQFEGMDEEYVLPEVLEAALDEWNHRVME